MGWRMEWDGCLHMLCLASTSEGMKIDWYGRNGVCEGAPGLE